MSLSLSGQNGLMFLNDKEGESMVIGTSLPRQVVSVQV